MPARLTRQVLQVVCFERVSLATPRMLPEVFGLLDARSAGAELVQRRQDMHFQGAFAADDDPANGATKVALADKVDELTISANTTNLLLGDLHANLILANVTADALVRGIDSWAVRRELTFLNVGTNTAYLQHQDTLAIADNRMLLPDSGQLAVSPGDAAWLLRDPEYNRWRGRLFQGLSGYLPGYWGANPSSGEATGVGGPF